MLYADEVKVGQRIRVAVSHGSKQEIQMATVTGIFPHFAQIVYDETGIRDTVALVPRNKVANK